MKKSNIVNYDTIFKLPKGLPTNSKQKHKLVIKGRKLIQNSIHLNLL